MFQNHNQILHRKEAIIERLQYIQELENTLPKGELLCRRNDNRYKWFHKSDSGTKYLPKNNEELAEQLALKRYYSLEKKELLEELEACNKFLEQSNQKKSVSSKSIFYHPEYNRLIEKKLTIMDKELQLWMEKEFQRNEEHPEQLTVKASQGKKVRSKSEGQIDHALFMAGIPFHYEEILVLNGIVLYPDFTTRHPKTGEFIYWEHFGIMDDRDYIRKTAYKIRTYSENGIVPSINLITTYETLKHPLDIGLIDKIIEEFYF